MRFSYAESMTDPSYYLPLARAAEEAGYELRPAGGLDVRLAAVGKGDCGDERGGDARGLMDGNNRRRRLMTKRTTWSSNWRGG